MLNKIRQRLKESNELSSDYLNKYISIYIVVLSIVSILEIWMIVRGVIFFDFSDPRRVWYMVLYAILLLASLITIYMLYRAKDGKLQKKWLGITALLYSTVIVAWSTAISCLDLVSNHYPVVYITIVITAASLLVVEPYYLLLVDIISSIVLIATSLSVDATIFRSNGDYINFVVFIVMAIAISFRHYIVMKKERDNSRELIRKSYTDTLTNLENGTAYFEKRDDIDKEMRKGKAKFILMLCDMNGLKMTNDILGHKYGSAILKHMGDTLPTIFKTSKCYRIGGDEFAVIVLGSDYDNFDTLINVYDEKLLFTEMEEEGQKLIVSFARGYSKNNPGETFSEVFDRADANMYKSKSIIKKTHSFVLKKNKSNE